MYVGIAFVYSTFSGLVHPLVQQSLLAFAGLEDFLLNAPRSNIISANKEGLISLAGRSIQIKMTSVAHTAIGYLSIHIIGLSLGTLILPPKPSFFRKQRTILVDGRKFEDTSLDLIAPRQTTKTIAELCAYTLVWWVLLAFICLKLAVSRRMVSHLISSVGNFECNLVQVNLPYILWISAVNTSCILGYFLLAILFFPAHVSRLKDTSDPAGKRITHGEYTHTPLLLEAINKNSLVIFLVVSIG